MGIGGVQHWCRAEVVCAKQKSGVATNCSVVNKDSDVKVETSMTDRSQIKLMRFLELESEILHQSQGDILYFSKIKINHP